jgi:hypothetical protein
MPNVRDALFRTLADPTPPASPGDDPNYESLGTKEEKRA